MGPSSPRPPPSFPFHNNFKRLPLIPVPAELHVLIKFEPAWNIMNQRRIHVLDKYLYDSFDKIHEFFAWF